VDNGILAEVRDRVHAAGLISSNAQFCQLWLGKSECYMRSLRFSGVQPSADALATCAARLAHTASELRAQGKHSSAADLDQLRVRTYQALDQRALDQLQRKGICV
jgi:hypothetical protein